MNDAAPPSAPTRPKRRAQSARATRRCSPSSPPSPIASTSSRRCAGSRAPHPTCRASALRPRPATSRCASARTPSLAFAPAPRSPRSSAPTAAPPRLSQRGLRLPRSERRRCRSTSPSTPASACSTTATRPSRASSTSATPLRPVLLSGLGAGAADRQPRPARRRPLRRYVGALIGLGEPAARRATRSATSRSSSSPAGCRARCATPTACEAWLTCFFGVPVRVEQFVRPLDARSARDERTRARRDARAGAARPRRRARRARSGTCSTSSASRSARWRWDRFESLLPGRHAARRSCARWCASTSASSSRWDLRLVLARDDVPRGRLGGRGASGSDHRGSAPRSPRRDADDLVLRARAIAARRAHRVQSSRIERSPKRSTNDKEEPGMSEISRVALFGKLNPLVYKAIEGATVFCKLRGNPVCRARALADADAAERTTPTCTASSATTRSTRRRSPRDITAALDRLPRGATVDLRLLRAHRRRDRARLGLRLAACSATARCAPATCCSAC